MGKGTTSTRIGHDDQPVPSSIPVSDSQDEAADPRDYERIHYRDEDGDMSRTSVVPRRAHPSSSARTPASKPPRHRFKVSDVVQMVGQSVVLTIYEINMASASVYWFDANLTLQRAVISVELLIDY